MHKSTKVAIVAIVAEGILYPRKDGYRMSLHVVSLTLTSANYRKYFIIG